MNQSYPQQPPYQQQGYPQQQQGYPQQHAYPQHQQQAYAQQQGYYQQPQRQAAPSVVPAGSPYPVLVSTMNDLPGFEVDQVFGEVFGLTVRSRDFGSNLAASFRSLGGGEVTQYTQMLAESRHVAVTRMCQMAQQMGANAILAMRFDCNEIAQTMSEVAAYGTAVVVRRAVAARPQDTVDARDDEPETEQDKDAEQPAEG